MEEENILSKSNIKKAVVKILKNNPNIDKISVETCGKCSWDKKVFENVPFWLVRELREENRTVASFKESANLIFDDKITFKLLCVYDFVKDPDDENLNHFT